MDSKQILEMECIVPPQYHGCKDPLYAYKEGFRDAQNKAAEIVSKGQQIWLLMGADDEPVMFFTEYPSGSEFKDSMVLKEYLLFAVGNP